MSQYIKASINIFFKAFIIALFFVLPIPVFAKKVELQVPFSSQAPDGKWVEPWRNACEETSTALIEFYYFGYTQKQVNIADAQREIMQLVRIENNYFGFNKDTNADQIVDIINNFLPWEAYVVKEPTLAQLKKELDNKHPIIIVAHGRDLHNTHYKSDQVDYHTFVLSGYDDSTQEFISQEPATQFGLDYRYKYDTIINAMHDFLPNDQTYRGRRVAVFTRKHITDLSRHTDGDQDGLSKEDELKYGTILRYQDSDGDGYTDGTEVINGYSPTIPSNHVKNGDLTKISGDPAIYLIQNNQRRHILNMEIMHRHKWDTQTIKPIDKKYLHTYFPKGKDITY